MRYGLTLYSLVTSIIWFVPHYLGVFKIDLTSIFAPLLWLVIVSIVADNRKNDENSEGDVQ